MLPVSGAQLSTPRLTIQQSPHTELWYKTHSAVSDSASTKLSPGLDRCGCPTYQPGVAIADLSHASVPSRLTSVAIAPKPTEVKLAPKVRTATRMLTSILTLLPRENEEKVVAALDLMLIVSMRNKKFGRVTES
jgi:hypothetical protein